MRPVAWSVNGEEALLGPAPDGVLPGFYGLRLPHHQEILT